MHRSWWFIGIIGMLCFASGCSTKTASQASNSNIVTTPIAVAPTEAAKPPNDKDFFPSPLISASSTIRPVPVPNLIPPTASVVRVPQVQAGRSDPFASLGYIPTVVKLKQSDNASLPSAISTVPLSKPMQPAPQTVSLPQPAILQPLPVPPPPATSLPSQNVPVQSSAETIQISGVVQVGGKTNVIIKDPNEQTSRSVAVGERLANGKVLVKRVQMGLEPVVILEQGGRDIVRSVGSSGALIGAL